MDVPLWNVITLIAAGSSAAIAAIAIGLSLVYFLLAKRLFRRIEGAVDEHENSVNQMYAALTKLSMRSESTAAEIEGRVLQLQGVVEQIGRDAKLSTKGDSLAKLSG